MHLSAHAASDIQGTRIQWSMEPPLAGVYASRDVSIGAITAQTNYLRLPVILAHVSHCWGQILKLSCTRSGPQLLHCEELVPHMDDSIIAGQVRNRSSMRFPASVVPSIWTLRSLAEDEAFTKCSFMSSAMAPTDSAHLWSVLYCFPKSAPWRSSSPQRGFIFANKSFFFLIKYAVSNFLWRVVIARASKPSSRMAFAMRAYCGTTVDCFFRTKFISLQCMSVWSWSLKQGPSIRCAFDKTRSIVPHRHQLLVELVTNETPQSSNRVPTRHVVLDRHVHLSIVLRNPFVRCFLQH